MFGIELVNTVRNSVQIPPAPYVKKIARSIMQNGNGQQRVVVCGFTGPNIDLKECLENSDLLVKYGWRYAVKGFNNINAGTALHTCNQRQKLRFFPNFNIPKLLRHIVYDFQPQRTVVKGFQQNAVEGIEHTGSSILPAGFALPKRTDLLANERVVVQGFGKHTASEAAKKTMDLTNTTPRVVVKGFSK